MSESQQQIARRRTFAIISHPDAGKTTLTEKLLLFGGAIKGENYTAQEASIDILSDGEKIGELNPQKRSYSGKNSSMTEASIDKGIMRDLYAAMGEPLGDGAWSLRLYYKPLIRWIWLGCILMSIGGVLAVSDKRYRQSLAKKITKPAGAKNVPV